MPRPKTPRPLCACGCGEPVKSSASRFASRACFNRYRWESPELREQTVERMRVAAQAKAADPKWRARNIATIRATTARPEWRAATTRGAQERAARPEWRQRMREVANGRLQDPAYRETQVARMQSLAPPRGEAHPRWKGGRVERFGYVYIRTPDHPNARVSGYVAEHRLVMEQHIGRYLRHDEHVHHINGIKNDNRIANLQLLSASDHSRMHDNLWKRRR